jgi:chromosome segregation ATPase
LSLNPPRPPKAQKLQRLAQRLQEQLAAAERGRDDASEQLFAALQQRDALQRELGSAEGARQQRQELERRVDVALELLGERNERIEQLEDDIAEMKGIFREQLEECAQQLAAALGAPGGGGGPPPPAPARGMSKVGSWVEQVSDE